MSGGARFCTYCGSSLAAPSAPLPSSPASYGGVPPPPPPPPPSPYGPPSGYPPPRRRRSRVLIVVVIVIVILLIGSIAAYEFLATGPPVQVLEIDIWAPDNVCGLNANPIGYTGYNTSTGAAYPIDLGVPNFNSTACTVKAVATNTSGFSLSGVQVPLTIAGNGTGSMNLTITSPGSSFSGYLNLVFS